MLPRRAVGSAQSLRGIGISQDNALPWVVDHRTPGIHRDVRKDATRRGDVPFLNVRHRATALFDGRKKINHVMARRGGGVQLNIFFRAFFRKLVALKHAVEVNRLGFAIVRNKVCAHRAQLERALLTIDEQRPRIIRIRRLAPCAMLPDGVQSLELERRSLRVGNVRLAILLHIDAAR